MRELTKNEKGLLAILGILLIGWGAYQFIITPQAQKLVSVSAERVEYEDKIQESNMLINRQESIYEDLDRLIEEQEEMVSGYFPKLHQAQTTYLLNDLLTVDDVEIKGMDFTRPEYEEFGDLQVKRMDISISYEGTYDAIMEVIKALKSSPRKIVVDTVSMDSQPEGLLEGSIALKVYGLDDMVDEDGDVIVIQKGKRDSIKTPFSVYESYDDGREDQLDPDEVNPWDNPSDPSRPSEPREELKPYSPEFSVDYEKDGTISVIPGVERK